MYLSKATEKAVQQYCELMIKTIEGLQQGWKKTWMVQGCLGAAQNINGREYTNMNQFMLSMLCEMSGYKYPIFMTCKQANDKGARVKKGELSFPVLFWSFAAKKIEDGDKITGEQYDGLTLAEKMDYKTYYILRAFNVFNVQQTTLQEDNPEEWQKIVDTYGEVETIDTNTDGMYVNAQLDAMIENNTWCCPIELVEQNRAYWSPSKDKIVLPTKAQFKTTGDIYRDGQEFYATALHEMAHSTGHQKRLNRIVADASFGDADYGKEELVAELTAATIGHRLGFNTAVQENNAAYLQAWLKSIKKKPTFLISVLSDVGKAVQMIESYMGKASSKTA